jgi:hypothetical protein
VVRSARSIKLVNDIELATSSGNGKKDPAENAMLIVAFGKTFSVTDSAPKKLIMNTLARAAIERDKALDCDEASHLLPGNASQKQQCDGAQNTNTMGRQKVTFVEEVDGSNGPKNEVLAANSPRYVHYSSTCKETI